MKTLTTTELDDKLSSQIDEAVKGLEDIELVEIEIERLSENLELCESIEQEEDLFNQAVKNLGLEYLLEDV